MGSSVRIGARMSREFDIKHICKYTSGEYCTDWS